MRFEGHCPICEKETTFIVTNPEWIRDYYFCESCKSIPRYRAICKVVEWFYPNLADVKVHETAPGGPFSDKLARVCKDHISFSNYYPDMKYGEYRPDGMRCENLECLTYDDESFDLFITQDVMEHVYDPEKAFKEINRVLKPGGMHIFTVALYNRNSITRATFADGKVNHRYDAEYHKNPIDPQNGSLVVTEWGQDIGQIIDGYTNMSTGIYTIRDKFFGIEGEFLDVIVSKKIH